MEELTEKENEVSQPLSRKERRELAKAEKRQEREKQENLGKVKKYLVWLVIAAVIVFAGYKLFKFINTPSGGNQVISSSLNVNASDHLKGKTDAPLTLVEYGDYQCPACAVYYPLVKQLLGDYPDKLKIVFRNYPLTQLHNNAFPAARAAEAASLQGKFWEMHDKIYDQQEEWSNLSDPKDKFVSYAESIGLDKNKFLTDYDSQEVKDKISADVASGDRLVINATPTFYLDGKKLPQISSYQDFKTQVDNEIQKQKK